MRAIAKKLIEGLLGNKFWVGHSSHATDVLQLISEMRPKALKIPLVRVGGDSDGGYLVPDDLAGVGFCVSPGVSDEITFDQDLARRGIKVFMADASVDSPPENDKNFYFEKKFIDTYEDDRNIRLDTFCQRVLRNTDGDGVLQMDIEGAEYRVLLDTSPTTLQRFRVMVIEFHNLDQMFCRTYLEIIRATFRKLMQSHYVVHIHPNNIRRPRVRGSIAIPPAMEFTFYRKDRAELNDTITPEFPHPLDADNIPQLKTVVLPKSWQNGAEVG